MLLSLEIEPPQPRMRKLSTPRSVHGLDEAMTDRKQ
jgi:hypothetical protein